jgi:SAM-dependent methyltransferase
MFPAPLRRNIKHTFHFHCHQEWSKQENGTPLLRRAIFQTIEDTFRGANDARLILHSATEHEHPTLQTRGFNEMMHGKAFHAPVDWPSRVLEVGVGTGHVAQQTASAFPHAEVIGLDLSAIPAGEKTDAVFVQGGVTDDGVVTGRFDFINSRMLVYGGIRDWPAYCTLREREIFFLWVDGWRLKNVQSLYNTFPKAINSFFGAYKSNLENMQAFKGINSDAC